MTSHKLLITEAILSQISRNEKHYHYDQSMQSITEIKSETLILPV